MCWFAAFVQNTCGSWLNHVESPQFQVFSFHTSLQITPYQSISFSMDMIGHVLSQHTQCLQIVFARVHLQPKPSDTIRISHFWDVGSADWPDTWESITCFQHTSKSAYIPELLQGQFFLQKQQLHSKIEHQESMFKTHHQASKNAKQQMVGTQALLVAGIQLGVCSPELPREWWQQKVTIFGSWWDKWWSVYLIESNIILTRYKWDQHGLTI